MNNKKTTKLIHFFLLIFVPFIHLFLSAGIINILLFIRGYKLRRERRERYTLIDHSQANLKMGPFHRSIIIRFNWVKNLSEIISEIISEKIF